MTAPVAQTAPAAPRALRIPWGTALLFLVSGIILVAQLLTRAPWSAGWLLSPGHVSFPTALTYAFFHADVLHWAVNMVLLLVVAPRLERGIGTFGMLGLFLLGAVVAGLLHVSMVTIFVNGQETQPLLGASGGIMALIGTYAVRYYNHPVAPFWSNRVLWPHRLLVWSHRTRAVNRRVRPAAARPEMLRPVAFFVPVGWVLFAWLISEAVFGWQDIGVGRGHVAHWAHVGGFLAGMTIAALTGMHRAGQREDAITQRTLDLQAQRLAGYLRENPEDIPSRITYAHVLVQLGDRDRAARAFCRAIEAYLAADRRRPAAETFLALRDAGLEPTSPALEVKAALALEDTGYIDEALAAYDRLSSTPGPEAESAGLRAARLADRVNRAEDARRRYHAFLLMFPQSQFAPTVRRSLSRLG